MFFIHRALNAVTMMYNEADELTACHFIRPSTYWKQDIKKKDEEQETDEVLDDNPTEVVKTD
jgi:hypothetical protein